LTDRITAEILSLGSTLPGIPGCAELTAAKLISESGDIIRFRNEAAYACYVGIAPVPVVGVDPEPAFLWGSAIRFNAHLGLG
jgi:transposase